MGTDARTVTRDEALPEGGPPPRLVTRPLLVRFVSIVGGSASFYLLLSTVPEYARTTGASAGMAGLTTTALTLSSVAAYPFTPRLMARYGVRLVLAAGRRQAWPWEAAARRRSTHHGPFGIMPFDFPADRPVQIPVNFCGSALAILGFADVGCQSGAAAFPDSFGAGS